MLIKSFKIFEMTMAELSNGINDFLVYFKDEGYKIENRVSGGGGISIYKDYNPLKQYIDKESTFSVISDDLIRLVKYLLSNSNKVIIDVEILEEKMGSSSLRYANSFKTLNILIQSGEKDWENRLLERIGKDSQIRSIIIDV